MGANPATATPRCSAARSKTGPSTSNSDATSVPVRTAVVNSISTDDCVPCCARSLARYPFRIRSRRPVTVGAAACSRARPAGSDWSASPSPSVLVVGRPRGPSGYCISNECRAGAASAPAISPKVGDRVLACRFPPRDVTESIVRCPDPPRSAQGAAPELGKPPKRSMVRFPCQACENAPVPILGSGDGQRVIAQLVEHWSPKPAVGGSSPSGPAIPHPAAS